MARRKRRDILTITEPDGEWLYSCTVRRVVDGDTVDLDVDTGFDIHFRMRVRLYGFNAPEKRKPNGPEATAHLSELICIPTQSCDLTNDGIFLESIRDRRGKYGRYLGILWQLKTDKSWVCINRVMVEAGYSV